MPVVTIAMLLFIQDRMRREAFASTEVVLVSAVTLLRVYMTPGAKAARVPINWLGLALTIARLAGAALRDDAAKPRR